MTMNKDDVKKLNLSISIGFMIDAIPNTKDKLVTTAPKISPKPIFALPFNIALMPIVNSGVVVQNATNIRLKTNKGIFRIFEIKTEEKTNQRTLNNKAINAIIKIVISKIIFLNGTCFLT